MPESVTARHALPNLFVGQVQKEVMHNEALARIDALLHPVAEGRISTPPEGLTETSDGLCWLISSSAVGIWSGRSDQIARWSGGSWRYLLPVAGMPLWLKSDAKRLFYINNVWHEPGAIAAPAGGTVIDTEARQAIQSILAYLRLVCGTPE